MRRIATITLAMVSLLATGCGPRSAGESKAAAGSPTGRDTAQQETGKLVTDLMSPTFSREQQGRILNMGYFMAASALCPDLEVDAQKMGRAVEAVLTLDPAGETGDQRHRQHDAVVMFLGMSTGAIIGSHMEDKARFCEDAMKIRGGPPEAHLFTTAPPSTPSSAPVPQTQAVKR